MPDVSFKTTFHHNGNVFDDVDDGDMLTIIHEQMLINFNTLYINVGPSL